MALYDRLMDVDLRGVFLGMKHGIRAMLPTGGGSIVNWSSIGGLNGSAGTSVYSAAKHGIIGASKSAAIEYGTQGIRINVICPGFILTEIMAVGAEDFIPDIAAKAMLNRAGESHEVAEVGAFLASDRASYITGAVIPVDGGWSSKLA
jgi:NAD(P)-dependent dehydrogenase (short-subunit alcohol dehydrogenase family)